MSREKNGSCDVPEEISGAYDQFLAASDFTPALNSFYKLCEVLDINPKNHKTIFSLMKSKLSLWKCQTLFSKLEKKGKHQDYSNKDHGKPCAKLKVLVIGAGPVGLRTAIEAAYLGANVMVVEKRDSFSRNNVLHLWPFLISDLKALGVKSFFGKFCAGTLDHISIRRLQCILLKVGLLLGVQFHTRTMIEGIVECTADKGWRGNFKPATSPLNSVDFDVVVGCDGSKANCLKFKRKEFRGKLAIAITCNFVNKKTSEEARVEEISGVAFIYNQEFFHELNNKTGIELENIVYYKDETHYFVMTAKKHSLLAKGVIKQDSKDVFKLLSADNINHKKLCDFSRESADFATKYQLPHHEFAVNHYGKEDVALFDFTSIHQAECASKIIERRGKKLLLCIAGDLLLEPFWPTGSGCARGFLGAMDASWMIRRFGMGHDPIDIIQERESIFTLLPQTTPESLMASHDKYSINPSTRYCNLNVHAITKAQARNYYDGSSTPVLLNEVCLPKESTDLSKPIIRKQEEAEHNTLLKWCQEQTADYSDVDILDFSTSWKNGLAFCAIINHFRPDLVDYASLKFNDTEQNCKKAFSVAEEHFGIPPKMSAHDFASQRYPDNLTIVAYVSLYYEALKNETPAKIKMELSGNTDDSLSGFGENNWTNNITSKMSIISRLTRNNKKKKRKSNKSKKDKENDIVSSKEESKVSLEHEKPTDNTKTARKSDLTDDVAEKPPPKPPRRILVETHTENSELELGKNKISMLAEAVFGDTTVQMGNQYPPRKDSRSEVLGESEKCHFCQRKVFVIERQSAEGYFFHRTCFRCFLCKCQLLLGNYAFHVDDDDNGKFYCKMHYNRVIYENEKNAAKTEKTRPFSTVMNVEQGTKESGTGYRSNALSKNRPRLGTTGTVYNDQDEDAKKSFRPVKSRVSDLKTMLEENDAENTLSVNKLGSKTPYEKFSSKQFNNRHPSLLRCGARKVTTNSFLTSSKLSVSTPNLAKLIQEDPLFEKEREEHKIIKNYDSPSKRDVTTENNIGAVHRRPIDERRAQYPVSMAFTDRVGELKSISVDIELNDSPCDTSGSSPKEVEKKKKKSPFIKKKKKLVPSKELLDNLNADSTPDASSSGESGVILSPPYPTSSKEAMDVVTPVIPKIIPESGVDGPDIEVNNFKKICVCTPPNMKFDSLPPLELEDEFSSSDEEIMPTPVTNKKKLGKKDKKKIEKLKEAKEKARADRRIKKEMKAREVKRLWQAQSIQRKLQEVDVKQYELEFKAKRLENELKNENNSPETRSRLTYEWISLVNEKNVLLRFESEFVIESNSIQLEDRQARLDQEIRGLLTCTDPKRNSKKEIDRLTAELVDTVEQRNALIEMLEEDRKRELEEDSSINVTFSIKAHELGFDRCI